MAIVANRLYKSNQRIDTADMKEVARSYILTEPLYKEALKETYPAVLGNISVHAHDVWDLKEILKQNGVEKPTVEVAYLKRILAMSTESLEFIIERHKNHKEKRAETTIDAILAELFERRIKSETKE